MKVKSLIRPGGFVITEKALEICKFPKGAQILDIGCGKGDTVAYLCTQHGLATQGIDLSKKMIAKGKEENPDISIQVGDGEQLPFSSRTFDGIVMECSLSLMPNPKEVIHEAYCTLKNEGYFIISDLYLENPSREDLEELENIKKEKKEKPHVEGQCETEVRISDTTIRGAFILNEITKTMEELNFEMILIQDYTKELNEYAASLIFEYGSFEAYQDSLSLLGEDPAGCCLNKLEKGKTKPGYFLLIGRKRK